MRGFTTLAMMLFYFCLVGWSQGVGFDQLLEKSPNDLILTCIENNTQNEILLKTEGITVRRKTDHYLFIQTTPEKLNTLINQQRLAHFHYDFSKGVSLADTSRVLFRVDSVQQGLGNLPRGYTGNGVLIGLVDTGVDYRHPDFLDSNGVTRVIRYWDQSINSGNAPQPYNYGTEFDTSALNAPSPIQSNIGSSTHGTSVTGLAAGNGRANGKNKGMAPDAKIVMVQTNFNLPNWSLSVSDACDYIFKIADEMNMPAVINLSLGSYLGSHDGNDPATEYMEALMEEKEGRIIVCAAGNAGNWEPFHVRGNASIDTTFTWLKNGANTQFGPNRIFFDLWADTSVLSTMKFGFMADKVNSGYALRGSSDFHLVGENLANFSIQDTVWSPQGNILATVTTYRSFQAGAVHLEVLFNRVDSTAYYYRFATYGSGQYDLWTSVNMSLNEIVTVLPSTSEMPKIIDYQAPDYEQSIVSLWNCSDKVVSVGNIKNRHSHVTMTGATYYQASPTPAVGGLSYTSSKGPSRLNLIKPDVVASGDMTLSPGPLAFLNNPGNNYSIDSAGWHIRQGGTSMASPIVAGIAALYLERCPKGNYQTFIDLLQATAYKDSHTGAAENNSYGYGKVNAYGVLSTVALESTPIITQNGSILFCTQHPSYQWFKNDVLLPGETNQFLGITPPNANYRVDVYGSDGCPTSSLNFQSALNLPELSTSLFACFPNPAEDFVDVQSTEKFKIIGLKDINGRELQLKQTHPNRIEVSSLPSGTYFIVVESQGQRGYIKFVRKQ